MLISGVSEVITTNYLHAAIAFIPVFFYAAVGEIYAENSGVINIGIEGIMVFGAFIGYAAVIFTNSHTIGFALAGIGGVILALIIAYLCVTLLLDQIVVGLGIFLAGAGLAGYLRSLVFPGGTPGSIETLGTLPLPVLSDLPMIGRLLFDHTILVYLTVPIAFASYYLLFRTNIGREIRASGEDPSVADSLGVNVFRLRYITLSIGGFLAAISGAYLSLVVTGRFTQNIVGGRGFIVLAIVIVSLWEPKKALAIVLLFSLLDVLGSYVQPIFPDAPITLFSAIPYVATIAMLLFIRTFGRTTQQMPSSLTVNYERSE